MSREDEHMDWLAVSRASDDIEITKDFFKAYSRIFVRRKISKEDGESSGDCVLPSSKE